MKRLPLVRRKAFLEAGIPNSQLIDLSQKNIYFKSQRQGEKNIFSKEDALLIFIANELWNFLPFRTLDDLVNDIINDGLCNLDGVLDDFVKNHRNLWRLLKQNPKNYLAFELRNIDFIEGIEMSEYFVYRIQTECLYSPGMQWEKRRGLILINLEPLYQKIETLFEKEGIIVG